MLLLVVTDAAWAPILSYHLICLRTRKGAYPFVAWVVSTQSDHFSVFLFLAIQFLTLFSAKTNIRKPERERVLLPRATKGRRNDAGPKKRSIRGGRNGSQGVLLPHLI